MNQNLVEIETFVPKQGEALSFFFEPLCEEITFEKNQSVTILAKCPDGVEVDLPAEITKDKNIITVYSQSGNAIWYTSCSGITVSTLQQAYNKELSIKVESSLF